MTSQLAALAEQYLDEAARTTAATLRRAQPPPVVTIVYGAAGMAYAHLHAEGRLAGASLDEAERWARAARRAAASWNERREEVRRTSLLMGPDGIALLELLVAHARGARSAFERALASFVRQARARRGRPELIMGRAGYLVAIVRAFERTGDERLGAFADDLARAVDAAPWLGMRYDGFGHGRAGVAFALLAWSRVRGRALPRSVGTALDALDAPAGGAPVTPEPWLGCHASWCNGAAGATLLWATAFETTRDPRHLERAHRSARVVIAAPRGGVVADLCCGLAGRAYAALALARIDPAGRWHAEARALADAAARADVGPWPNGLTKGYPGLVCLAADLARAPARGFPLVEA